MQEYFTIASKADGLIIDCLHVRPDGDVKACVLMSHGVMEYKERYMHVINALAGAGYACAINDHRGHGKSIKATDDLGYTYEQGAQGTLADARALGEWLKAKYPDKPMFLYGHSMGALCAMCLIKTHAKEFAGAVMSGLPAPNPAAGAGKQYLKLKRMLKGARFRDKSVNKLMFDNYSAKFKGETSPFRWLNSDSAKVAEYDKDDKCGFLCTVDGYLSIIDLIIEAYDISGFARDNPDMPILLIAGADDPCAGGDEGAQKQIAHLKRAGFVNVNSRLYPGMRHEIHNEPEGGKVIADIIEAFAI